MKRKPTIRELQYNEGYGLAKIVMKRSKYLTTSKRTDHKLLDILAYLGGLATPILTLIKIFADAYNKYSYEIELSHRIYNQVNRINQSNT